MDTTAFYTQGQQIANQQNLVANNAAATQSAQKNATLDAQAFALLLDGALLDQGPLQAAVNTGSLDNAVSGDAGASLLNTPLNASLTDILSHPVVTDGVTDGLISISGEQVAVPDAALTSISEILLLDGSDLGTEPGLLARLTDTINQIQQNEGAQNILFNLTPKQITQLNQDIATLQQTGELPQSADGFAFVLVQLTAPPVAVVTGQGAGGKTGNNVPAQTIAQGLALLKTAAQGPAAAIAGQQQNAGKANGEAPAATASSVNNLSQTADPAAFDGLLDIQNSTEKFTALLKQVAAKKGAGQTYVSNAEIQAQNTNAANNNASVVQPPTPAPTTTAAGSLEGWPFADGSLLSSLDLDQTALQALGLQKGQFQVTGLQDLMNVTTQARQAGLPHPGTALVAASFGKAANNPGNQVVTLRLDPPELGKVEIRMEFGPDKSVKALVVSEKPEAHLMLQRDAQVLERALQELGLDGAGSSLEFTMSDDGQNFGQDGRHDGSRNGANGMSGDEDLEIVESTMNWHVDPNTGHMHYNILV